MGVKLTTEEFIRRAVNTHGDVYDYSLSEYTGAQEEVNIFCKRHEKYFLQRANDHNRGSNCPDCARYTMGKRLTEEEFIDKSKEIHKDLYEYDKVDYINNRTKVEIFCKSCRVYFFQTPDANLRGCGCKKCGISKQTQSRSKTKEQFVEDANKVHSGLYEYSLVEYTNNTTNVKILCKKHGLFTQNPSSHIIGQGCPHCAKEEAGGWRRSDWIKKANGRVCTFYTIRCFNEEEEFYKIGRTMNSIGRRYNSNKMMPYNYEILSEIKGEAGSIWDLERDEKKKLKKFHYEPKIDFSGSVTECFTDYKI